MRLKRLTYFLPLILFLALSWPEAGSRVLNKDSESFAAKLKRGIQHDLHRDFHNARSHWPQSVQERNESFSIDEQDAILFQYIIANLIQSLQQSISVVSDLIRICGDTLAGVMSGMVKATGGLLNLASKVLYYVSAKLDASQENSPAFLGNFTSKCAFGLKKAAPFLHYAGEACIYSGEILESMTLGLGEAVQDSYWGLEVVSNSTQVIISFLLQIDEVDSIASMRRRMARSKLSSGITDDSVPAEEAPEASTVNKSLSNGSVRHIRNILHTRPHSELNMHIMDSKKPFKSSIDVKLGKEWIAPDAAVISALDPPSSSAQNLPNDEIIHNSEQSTNNKQTHNYTTYNATNLVLKVRHVWSVLVNKTSNIAKQLSNHTHSIYLADAASSTIHTDEVIELESDDLLAETVLPPTTNYYTLVEEIPQLLTENTIYTLSLSYRILQTLIILLVQLYTTVVAAQGTESSQGAFFLLALVATYIISIIPFQSMRAKICTLLCFVTLVYCSFITTEQIQRDKLIHNTSVQSAHSLLLQQAQQRHHRSVNPKLFDNVIRDSSSLYSSSEYAEISTAGEAYVQSDDVITSPHYEHTPTQDVYSNINHHTSHQLPSTANINYTDLSIANNTTNYTTTLLFDDAIWLNTLLTSIWDINDAHFKTHGLGAYLNEVYEEYVNIELNNIPPSVANIRLKSFDLGRAAPLFKGVRVFRVRDHVCMKQNIQSEFGTKTAAATNENSNITSKASVDRIHDTILAKLWQSIEKSSSPFWSTNSGSTNNSTNTDNNRNSSDSVSGDSVNDGGGIDPSAPTSTSTASAPAETLPTAATPAASQAALLLSYQHILSQFSADCDSLIIEMDTIFLSSNMNIVLTLRQALKSAFPEITATLSEVSLSGQLRLKVKLTPDYPFVGDGQLSFLSAPQLGFSLSGLGGIELSSVPYAFQWVNSSMHYVLEQYTAPKYMELDIRHTLCATCDLPLVPAHDLGKVLKHGVTTAAEKLKQAAAKAKVLWAKVDTTGRQWASHLHTAVRVAQHHVQQGIQHVQHTIDAHTARSIHHQDRTSSGNSDSEGEGQVTSVPEEQRGLHFTRYKSFETVEESDMHPELKNEEGENKREGEKEIISKASALWKKGQSKWKEAVQNIGNDRSVNELVYLL
eukprot:gene11087-12920_t